MSLESNDPAKNGALGHLKVLDLTHHIAGPFCTKLLADFGAEVIKVERPGSGDPARRFGPFPGDVPHPEKSGIFLYLNTNKRGVTLNLKSPAGLNLARDLARQADIVVESFRPGVLACLGLDYETLSKENPRLVVVSISNFGQTGPYRDYRATEIVEQAMGGLMYTTGLNQREPLKEALAQGQYWAGALAAAATLTSVVGGRMTGQGDHVDVSIQECIASGLQSTIMWYSFMGVERRRQARAAGGLNYMFPCKDGYVVPMVGGGQSWEVFANCLETEELLAPQFATQIDRLKNAEELNNLLVNRFRDSSKHEIFHRGQEWGMQFGLVQSPADLAACPQLESRDFWRTMDHPEAGKIGLPGPLFRMSASPWQLRRPAPTLGQHNEEVYCGRLGYSREDLAVLARTEVI